MARVIFDAHLTPWHELLEHLHVVPLPLAMVVNALPVGVPVKEVVLDEECVFAGEPDHVLHHLSYLIRADVDQDDIGEDGVEGLVLEYPHQIRLWI